MKHSKAPPLCWDPVFDRNSRRTRRIILGRRSWENAAPGGKTREARLDASTLSKPFARLLPPLILFLVGMASGSVFLPAQERRQMRNPISIEQERTLSSTSFAEGAAYPESELWRYTAGGWEKASWLTAETHCVPSTKNPRVHPAYLGGFLMLMMIGFRCLPVCKSD